MLNIFYGNESVDKERFIFDDINKNKGNTILIVPDQFSAQTERNAFFYLGQKATMDLRILNFKRLGYKAVKEAGIPVPKLIDKYGRHMLLTKIIAGKEKAGSLNMYKTMSGKNTFVSMMNSLISEMKRNNVTPDILGNTSENLDGNRYLKYKIDDIVTIFSAYEEAIKGKYLDSEDYITFYGDAIKNAQTVAGARVWIYGFDTFTAKNMQVIARLAETAECVNVVMNYEKRDSDDAPDGGFLVEDDRSDIFALTGRVIEQLKTAALEAGSEVNIASIEGFERKSIWSMDQGGAEAITLAHTTNHYEEAERAAAYMLELVRDRDYRYSDISVICNDIQGLGGILGRTLERWGVPVFMDHKRKVMHHPAVALVITLMDIAAAGFRRDSVMRLVKTGLMELEEADCELLENYAFTFKVRGKMWQEPFVKKGKNFSDEDLIRLNDIRRVIVEVIENVKDSMGRRTTAGEKIRGLYSYLITEFKIEERLQRLMDVQEEAGFIEASFETGQSWNTICEILDQIVEIIGDSKVSNGELHKLITDGLEEIEMGLVPTSSDCILIGTMQRTRLSRSKILMVIGANEGVLPMSGTDEGLLSETELKRLEDLKISVGKTDETSRGEETLAIYRNLSAPEERLYMSCSKFTGDGEPINASGIFENLKAYMTDENGDVVITGDLSDEDSIINSVTTPAGTITHLADAIREYRENGKIDDDWHQVINWYLQNDEMSFNKMRAGMDFSPHVEILEKNLAQSLYMGNRSDMLVSVSRLEKYSECPFAHFMNYGLRPEQLEEYGIGAGQTGDIYHECIMRFSEKLSAGGLPINDECSPWMQIKESECREMIRNILLNEMSQYSEGLINSGKEEEYRVSRIANICTGVAMTLVKQVQKGQIKSMAFEKSFGPGEDIGPICINVGEKRVMLRGIIDRLDILDVNEDQSAVRIVDYKTGETEIRKEYYAAGYKLQLMVYLNAVMAGVKEDMVPAGVFHFNINELDENDDSGNVSIEDFEKRRDRNYRLKGFVINDEKIIRSMDRDFEKESDVIPVKIKKDEKFAAAAKGKLFSGDEFKELCEQVDGQVQRICEDILNGTIKVAPVKEKFSACNYCKYRGVCMFDTSLPGCRYTHLTKESNQE